MNMQVGFFLIMLNSFSLIFALSSPRDLYLDLMKKCLINSIYEDTSVWYEGINTTITSEKSTYNQSYREDGRDHPSVAHTMIGLKRLNNIQFCIEDVIRNKVPGDFIETGVWRGGGNYIHACSTQSR